MFALQDGGWCASSDKAEKTFNKYGKSEKCKKDGEGGPWASQVYYIRGNTCLGSIAISYICHFSGAPAGAEGERGRGIHNYRN